MKLEVKTLAAKDAGAIDLDDAVFGIEELRADLLQRAVKWQLAARQQGTHKTKGRSEIARTKKKFGRQKGGGGARHGARSAPIFVGGGRAHGPRVRSHFRTRYRSHPSAGSLGPPERSSSSPTNFKSAREQGSRGRIRNSQRARPDIWWRTTDTFS